MAHDSLTETPGLIFVEGIGGSGKSTTAQWIAMALRNQGLPARWLHESESQNQLRAYFQVEVDADPEKFIQKSIRSWEAFSAQSGAGDEIHVLDGSLFQVTMVGLLLHDVAVATIKHFVREVMGTVDPQGACLVYLRRSNIARTLEHACSRRYETLLSEYIRRNEESPYGQARQCVGMAGLVEFCREIRRLSDELFAECPFRKVLIEQDTEDWPRWYKRISSHLRIEQDAAAPEKTQDLRRYTGSYRRKRAGGTTEFSVAEEEGNLVVFGLDPYLWKSGNRLIPRAKNVFLAASWPTEVIFEEDSSGRVINMRLETTDQGWRRTDEVFSRVLPDCDRRSRNPST